MFLSFDQMYFVFRNDFYFQTIKYILKLSWVLWNHTSLPVQESLTCIFDSDPHGSQILSSNLNQAWRCFVLVKDGSILEFGVWNLISLHQNLVTKTFFYCVPLGNFPASVLVSLSLCLATSAWQPGFQFSICLTKLVKTPLTLLTILHMF